jgi:hypothetical protein
MPALAGVLLLALPLSPLPPPEASRLEWSRDHEAAYARAEERRAPLLLHFRGANCGIRNAPGATDDRAGAGMAGGLSRPAPAGELNDCDLMQMQVWEDRAVAREAGRFLAVLSDSGDQRLNVRYQVVVNPTTLIADPWGNEIFRVAHYLEADKMARLLAAIPEDFKDLEPFGRALRLDSGDLEALMGAAAFYQGRRLAQVSERLYERAAATRVAAGDLATRRQVAIARGLNLLLMNRDREAAAVFGKALEESARGEGSDALLLGLVNAHLQGGRRKEAEHALKTLEEGWAGSPYAARARQNFDQRPAK